MKNERPSYQELEKQIEILCKEKEQTFFDLHNNSPDMFVSISLDKGTILNCNETLLKVTGYSKDEVIGFPIFKMYHNDCIEEVKKTFQQFVEKGKIRNHELILRKKNGSKIFVLLNVNALKNTIDHKLYSILSWRDITNLKNREFELLNAKEKAEENERKLNEAQKLAHIGSWFYDPFKNESMWSEETYNIWGLDPSINPVKYSDHKKLVHPDDWQRFENTVKESVEKGNSYNIEIRIVRPNGLNKTVNTIGEPIYDNNNKIIAIRGTTQDITERKLAEIELIKAKEKAEKSEIQLRELNATKDKLFSIISHDLRGPFNSILGLSTLLTKSIEKKGDEDAKSFTKLLNASAKSALILVDNLLNWARSQTGQIKFNPVTVNLEPIIIEIFDILNPTAETKNISLNYNQSIQVELYADENMLKTVLRNLISNGIKFTNKGGKIDVFTKQRQNFVEITVSDNGVGMNKKFLDKLFIIDKNLTTNGTANEKGSGLGLILCKEFINRHGGKIWVESESGKGSTFMFTLPLIKTA